MANIKPIAIKKRTPKTEFKGFGGSAREQCRRGWRFYAIEFNKEDVPMVDGELDLKNAEPIDLLELHHIAFSPVVSCAEKHCLKVWAKSMCDIYLSPYEVMAEFYCFTQNYRAIQLGANVARIYYNSKFGDDRIRSNSIGHYYDDTPPTPLVSQALAILKNHLSVERIVGGEQVTLKNRLGND